MPYSCKAGTGVVALRNYQKRADKLLSPGEQEALFEHLAARPEVGRIIPGTGGVRKARWGLPGRGKRGGVRVIYYYYVIRNTVYLMLIYSKSEQADLSPEQKKDLRTILRAIQEE